ncbi:MAG: hypothetical protein HY927_00125 [Elusimicrobia bacterium]|nr:hypothetical protein [Elusimicrobiota bacterium]
MRNWLVGLFVAAILGNAAAGFAGERIDFDQGVDARAVIQNIKEATGSDAAPGAFSLKGTREWTVMVYINGKNNLETYGLKDVNEMEAVGSSDKVGVAVELGRIKGYSSEDGDWVGSRRYLVKKDNDTAKITSPVLQDLGKVDMGDWKHLVDFVNWAKAAAPAKRYMLVVWNHGSGWDRLRSKDGDVWTTGISYDDETGNHISTAQLGQAMAGIGKVDIYASDACLMQMAEVDYQIKDFADVIVGSEETEPADGYSYDTLLAGLAAAPAATAAELGKITARTYTAHYAKLGQGATQSAVNAAALGALLKKAGDWTSAVMAAKEVDVLKGAMKSVQDFYYSDNKDLYHFVKLVTDGTKDAAVKAKGTEFLKFIAGDLLVDNAATGSAYANAFGLAVYLPSYSYSANYDKLAWSVDGNWGKFAKWVSDVTKAD